MKAAACLVALAGAACGSPPPAAYMRENEAALTALRQGEHGLAAQHYERAAARAEADRDRDEARYRAAESHARAGDVARAEAIYEDLARHPESARSARADFALAALWARGGQTERAERQRVAAIRKHPSSGLSRKALETHVRYLRSLSGSSAALAFLQQESSALAASELSETLAYLTARELEEAGDLARARDAYLTCAARFPYPRGAYWDDALFRAARAELELGHPESAVGLLQKLLAERESANFTGSYERPRYAQAQLELGRIYRDVLGNDERARQELRKVWQNHPRSTLADGALFQEALLARRTGDGKGACATARLLTEKLPQSRFAACAPALCPSLPPATGPCHDYIKRAAGLP